MKTGKLLFLYLTILCIAAITINGCKKATVDPISTPAASTPPSDEQVAADIAEGDYIFNNINNIVDDAARSQGGVNKTNDTNCYYVKETPQSTSNFPKYFTLKYGGCAEDDKKIRKGLINFSFTNKRNVEGSVMKIEYKDFKINTTSVTGKTIVTTIAVQSQGNYPATPTMWNTTVEGSFVSNGVTKSWTSEKTRVWAQGANTPTYFKDDQLNYFGFTKGSNFDSTRVEPRYCLVTTPGCPYILSGKVTIYKSGGKKVVIDYGTDNTIPTCDSLATISVNGSAAVQIILK